MINRLKNIYGQLPIVKELRRIQQALHVANLAQINAYVQNELLHSPKYEDKRKLNHFEGQVFSQNGEDGVICEIFRRIGAKSRYFVEFGVGNGMENNTVFLLDQGWRGSWIEGDPQLGGDLKLRFNHLLGAGRLRFANKFITAENIVDLFEELEVPKEFDLLSLDIDRNTYHIWKALSQFKPRVVVVEYNATFPPAVKWVAKYDATRAWNQSAYFGASLKAYEEIGMAMGYALVGCDFSGTNAFFVSRSEDLELFAKPFTAESHYEPPRYWTYRREAHGRCFDDTI